MFFYNSYNLIVASSIPIFLWQDNGTVKEADYYRWTDLMWSFIPSKGEPSLLFSCLLTCFVNYCSLIVSTCMHIFRLGEKDRDSTSMTLIPFPRNLTFEVSLIGHTWKWFMNHAYKHCTRPPLNLICWLLLFKKLGIFSFVFLIPKWKRSGYICDIFLLLAGYEGFNFHVFKYLLFPASFPRMFHSLCTLQNFDDKKWNSEGLQAHLCEEN